MTVNDTLLACVPPAGSGASFFRSWKGELPVAALQLPGRENRLADPMPDRLSELTADLLSRLEEAADGFRAIAVLGHSFGAMVAFELCRALSLKGRHAMLIASGAAVPGRLVHEPISALPAADLAARIAAITGYEHPAMEDPDLFELLIPTLRTDLRLHEEYAPAYPRLQDVPVLGIRGSHDRLIPGSAVRRWARLTTGSFRYAEVPGGHMYLAEEPTELLRVVTEFVTGVGLAAGTVQPSGWWGA
jgi:surfactin synthase thioesterase subunit